MFHAVWSQLTALPEWIVLVAFSLALMSLAVLVRQKPGEGGA